MFMSEPVKNLNIAAYDIPRQLASKDYAKALRGAFAIALSAALIKMIEDGIPALGNGGAKTTRKRSPSGCFPP